MFELIFAEPTEKQRKEINNSPSKAGLAKQINKSLGYLQTNPKHPSLNSHPFDSIENPINPNEKVFVAYAQNKTPSAYRIFWCYGPGKKQVTIIAITPHP